MDIADLDPIRLVADDVMCLVKDTASLQAALCACDKWARANGLTWNPTKSQILYISADGEEREDIMLGNTVISWTNEVDYLGMRLGIQGFLGKEVSTVEEKSRAAVYVLINEVWFNLNLKPKYIVREYLSHVYSTMLYGSELLSTEARKHFVDVDEKMMNLFLRKFLKLGRTKLAVKHHWRLQFSLGIPTLSMDIYRNIHGFIKSWIEKRTSKSKKFADRASDFLRDITKLDADHPLRVALQKYSPGRGKPKHTPLHGWSNLESDSRGATPNPGDRQLKAAITTEKLQAPSLVEETNMNGDLRKAALHWSVYRFPVKYVPSASKTALLEKMPRWQDLQQHQKAKVKENLLTVYKEEEKAWGRAPLDTSCRPDIRSQTA